MFRKGKGIKMRKKLKKALSLVAALALTLTMSTVAFAADDIPLNDSGSPFVKTFDPGTGDGDYKYMGYVYCFEVGPEYKYLQISYTGEATAFEQLRLEFVVNSDPSEEIKLTPIWFAENDEGTFKTVDGGLVPAPSSTEQTVVIDLEASGVDLSTGIRAFHVHDTPGQGAFTITDAKLMTTAPAGTSTTPVEDKKDEEVTKKEVKEDTEKEDTKTEETTASTMGATTGGGATAAPATGSATYPIAVAVGGIVVAGIAFAASKKMKED